MKIANILLAVCAGAAFSAASSMRPGFDAGRVASQVRAARAAPRLLDPSPSGLETGEFLIDTSVARVPAQGSQTLPAVAFDGANFLVVWQDDRGGVVFGARVTPGGEVLDPLGIVVTPAPGDRGSPAVGFDGANFLVLWEENRVDWDIYGTRVSSAGTVLDPSGIPISISVDDQLAPALAFDGANFLVVWEDDRDDSVYNNVYGARVTPAGTVLDTSGIPISTAANDQSTPCVAFDGVGFFTAWEDGRNDSAYNIYGSRVTSQGAVLDPSGIPISTAPNEQLMPGLTFDGADLLAVWGDNRGGSGYDIYGARITPDGAVLDPSGIPISQAASDQNFATAAFDGQNFLVAWGDYRSGNNYDIYGTRVTPAGAVLDPAGLVISPAARDQYFPATGFDGADFLVVWQDDRGGSGYDIYGARVTPQAVVLDPGGLLASRAANGQNVPSAGFDGANFLVVWQDDRGGSGWDIYGARVTPDGEVLDPAGFAISQAAHDQNFPAVGFDGSSFLVAWEDNRGGSDLDIYGARVTPEGEVLDPAGFVIAQATDEQSGTAIVYDGANSLVVWQDYRDGTRFHIYGARVTSGGAVLDPAGLAITGVPGVQYAPAIAFDGTNSLVVWQDSRNGSDWDIYGARLSPGGEVLDPSGIALSQADYHQRFPAVAFDGANFLLAWQDTRYGYDNDIFGARATPGGLLLDPSGRPFSTYPLDQLLPALAFDGASFLVAWQDFRNGNDYDVFGARVSTAGSVFEGGPIVRQQGDQVHPRLGVTAGGEMLLAYQGWAGTVDGKAYNSSRTWGKVSPNPGIVEAPSVELRGTKPEPTIIRGVLFLGGLGTRSGLSDNPVMSRAALLDAGGRKVMDLRPGANDVGRLAPGVYFVRQASSVKHEASSVTKVILIE